MYVFLIKQVSRLTCRREACLRKG